MTPWRYSSATVVNVPDSSQLGDWYLDAHQTYDVWRGVLYLGQTQAWRERYSVPQATGRLQVVASAGSGGMEEQSLTGSPM